MDKVSVALKRTCLGILGLMALACSGGSNSPGPQGAAPAIASNPTDLTVKAGDPASFTVTATGTPSPTFRWQRSGSDIPGASNATYTIAATSRSDNGSRFRAVATNSAGSATSSEALLTVQWLQIATQPQSLSAVQGQQATFHVVADANPQPTYQWQKNGSDLPRSNSDTLNLPSVSGTDAGSYTVRLANAARSLTSAAAILTVTAPPAARTLTLVPSGASRVLPPRLLGASAEPHIEHLLDTPSKRAAIQATAPGTLRFPGGSLANYYDWRDGQLHLDPQSDSSSYYIFWANLAKTLALAHPDGIKVQDYAPFANQVGADCILDANLETSTVQLQSAWFQDMATRGIAPSLVELGNEFYYAMLNDPHVLQKWPDEPSSFTVMQQYQQQLRPLAAPGAKFAVQAVGASLNIHPNAAGAWAKRLLDWDEALLPAPWFEAATIHVYPDIPALQTQPGGRSPFGLWTLLMGRMDAGIDRAVDEMAARLPGTEIWITEWSPRGGLPPDSQGNFVDPVSPAMAAHIATRVELAFLRHPEITRALYFDLSFNLGNVFQCYVPSGSQWLPLPAVALMGWFHQAANQGPSYQRVVEQGGTAVATGSDFQEHFLPVEGAEFVGGSGRTLILQNASAEDRLLDATYGGARAVPASVDLMQISTWDDDRALPAQIQHLAPGKNLLVPAYSVVRIVWPP
jgi:Immunoglobulin domain/Immunoglobulin I-set domain